MACQILTAPLAEVARPQATGVCVVYDFGHFIITLVNEVQIVTFDNQNLALL